MNGVVAILTTKAVLTYNTYNDYFGNEYFLFLAGYGEHSWRPYRLPTLPVDVIKYD